MGLLLVCGLASWIATVILVEGEITAGIRHWVSRRYLAATKSRPVWHKLKYLVGCHLCAGTWISLTIAVFLPPLVGPWFVGWVLNGLVVKAIGHLALIAQHLGERWSQPAVAPLEIKAYMGGQNASRQQRHGAGSGGLRQHPG